MVPIKMPDPSPIPRQPLLLAQIICEGYFVHEAHAFHEWGEQDGSGKANRMPDSIHVVYLFQCIRTGASARLQVSGPRPTVEGKTLSVLEQP